MKNWRESEFLSKKHFKEVMLEIENDGVEFVDEDTVMGYIWTS